MSPITEDYSRPRAGAIIINGSRLLLIHRWREGVEYYVFPGGRLDPGESPEEATVREVQEELGLDIEPEELLYENIGVDNQHQYYFLAHTSSVEAKLNEASEEAGFASTTNRYLPEWVEFNMLEHLPIVPVEIKAKLIADIAARRIY